MIDAMPDVVPVVDRVPGLEGLIVATGMSGHGFGIGPGFGKVVTNIATGRPPATTSRASASRGLPMAAS
jgi:glycine/D-amino acid oxidase-like deaminating enzyme